MCTTNSWFMLCSSKLPAAMAIAQAVIPVLQTVRRQGDNAEMAIIEPRLSLVLDFRLNQI